MPQLIGVIVIVVLLGVGIIIMSASNEPSEVEFVKTEKMMIMQETESTNRKLSNR